MIRSIIERVSQLLKMGVLLSLLRSAVSNVSTERPYMLTEPSDFDRTLRKFFTASDRGQRANFRFFGIIFRTLQ